jgi:hypothetical protein
VSSGRWSGGFVATQVLSISDSDHFDFGSFLIAVGTSVVLLAVWERANRMLPERRRQDRAGRGL